MTSSHVVRASCVVWDGAQERSLDSGSPVEWGWVEDDLLEDARQLISTSPHPSSPRPARRAPLLLRRDGMFCWLTLFEVLAWRDIAAVPSTQRILSRPTEISEILPISLSPFVNQRPAIFTNRCDDPLATRLPAMVLVYSLTRRENVNSKTLIGQTQSIRPGVICLRF